MKNAAKALPLAIPLMMATACPKDPYYLRDRSRPAPEMECTQEDLRSSIESLDLFSEELLGCMSDLPEATKDDLFRPGAFAAPRGSYVSGYLISYPVGVVKVTFKADADNPECRTLDSMDCVFHVTASHWTITESMAAEIDQEYTTTIPDYLNAAEDPDWIYYNDRGSMYPKDSYERYYCDEDCHPELRDYMYLNYARYGWDDIESCNEIEAFSRTIAMALGACREARGE